MSKKRMATKADRLEDCRECRRRTGFVQLETDLVRDAGAVVAKAWSQSRDTALDLFANEMVQKGFLAMIGEVDNPDRFDILEDIGYWRGWIEAQAKILWMYRGGPWGQDVTRQMDDFMMAKRYFAYLLTDHLLTLCIEQISPSCPLAKLSSKYARYLQSITIHQFAQFRAYFRRLKEHRNSDFSLEERTKDYLEAIDHVDCAFNANCPSTRQTECVAWKVPPAQSEWETIKQAKANIVRLLEPDAVLAADISRYVDSFYEWLSHCEESPKDISIHEQLLRRLYNDTHIVNVFEVLVKCFLARKVDFTKHEAIRGQLSKQPLATTRASGRLGGVEQRPITTSITT